MSENLLSALRGCGVADLLPAGIERQLSALELQGATSLSQGGLEVLKGTAVPGAGATLPSLSGLPLEAPAAAGDLPVQIAVQKGGAAPRWAVDLALDPLALPFPGLRPAQEVVQPQRPTVLVAHPAGGRVRVVGRAALRIAAAGGATPRIGLVDALHEGDPFGSHGAISGLRLDPVSFFVGDSEFGFTVEDFGFDDSGLTLRRATLFLPPGAPVVGDVALGVQDLFLGNPVGVKGTAGAELGGDDDPASPPFGVRIEVEWDDPNARGLAEAVPGRAEATVSLPGTGSWRCPAAAARRRSCGPGTEEPRRRSGSCAGAGATIAVRGPDEFTLALDATAARTGSPRSSRPARRGLGLPRR